MSKQDKHDFWISDARRELVLTVRKHPDLYPEEIRGPMIEAIQRHLNLLSQTLGNLELVHLRTKQGDITL